MGSGPSNSKTKIYAEPDQTHTELTPPTSPQPKSSIFGGIRKSSTDNHVKPKKIIISHVKTIEVKPKPSFLNFKKLSQNSMNRSSTHSTSQHGGTYFPSSHSDMKIDLFSPRTSSNITDLTLSDKQGNSTQTEKERYETEKNAQIPVTAKAKDQKFYWSNARRDQTRKSNIWENTEISKILGQSLSGGSHTVKPHHHKHGHHAVPPRKNSNAEHR